MRKTQIMHVHLISDSATFPWSKSAQPGGLSIFIDSFASYFVTFFKKQLYFSTTYRYSKGIYLDLWPGLANGLHIYGKWDYLWQLHSCCYKYFDFSTLGQKIVIIHSVLLKNYVEWKWMIGEHDIKLNEMQF